MECQKSLEKINENINKMEDMDDGEAAMDEAAEDGMNRMDDFY